MVPLSQRCNKDAAPTGLEVLLGERFYKDGAPLALASIENPLSMVAQKVRTRLRRIFG